MKISRSFGKKDSTFFGRLRNAAATVYFADNPDGTFGVGSTPGQAKLDAIKTYIETKRLEAEDR